MGDLMAQHAGQLILTADAQDQPGVHIDVATWGRKRVELGFLHDRELIGELRMVQVGNDALSQTLHIALDRIIPHERELRLSDQRKLAAKIGLARVCGRAGREVLL